MCQVGQFIVDFDTYGLISTKGEKVGFGPYSCPNYSKLGSAHSTENVMAFDEYKGVSLDEH